MEVDSSKMRLIKLSIKEHQMKTSIHTSPGHTIVEPSVSTRCSTQKYQRNLANHSIKSMKHRSKISWFLVRLPSPSAQLIGNTIQVAYGNAMKMIGSTTQFCWSDGPQMLGLSRTNGEQTGEKMAIFESLPIQNTTAKLEKQFICCLREPQNWLPSCSFCWVHKWCYEWVRKPWRNL